MPSSEFRSATGNSPGGRYIPLLDASVTVASTGSYGARVVDSAMVFWEREALGKPDKRGAWIFERGWICIELKSMVKNCKGISIWAANIGWRAPRFEVYASTDGKRWTLIGSGVCSSYSYIEYTFSGTYGDVRYIKVKLKETIGGCLHS